MKRTITAISLAVVISSLLAIGVPFQGPDGGKGSLVPSVEAKDHDDDDRDRTSRPCSLRTLNGFYGGTFIGTIIGFGPIAGVGVNNYDGRGHLTSTSTVNINGSGGISETATGTYTVNSDCTGSTVSTLSPSGLVVTSTFVIVNQGKETLFVNTAPGIVITGSEKKQ